MASIFGEPGIIEANLELQIESLWVDPDSDTGWVELEISGDRLPKIVQK